MSPPASRPALTATVAARLPSLRRGADGVQGGGAAGVSHCELVLSSSIALLLGGGGWYMSSSVMTAAQRPPGADWESPGNPPPCSTEWRGWSPPATARRHRARAAAH